MRVNHGGFTLIELTVAMVLAGMVAVLTLGTVSRLQRRTQGMAERAAAQATLRSGVQLLRSELRELSGRNQDLLLMAADRMIYRADRGYGRACGTGPGEILLRRGSLRALRLPSAGRDTLEVLQPAAGVVPATWFRAGVTGPPRAAQCLDGGAALALPVAPVPPVADDSPIRTWEVMEVRGYVSGSETWLGARSLSAGEAIQPVAGPLTGSGLLFEYLDSASVPTADRASVRTIVVTLWSRGGPAAALGGAAGADVTSRDSIRFLVRLLGGDQGS